MKIRHNGIWLILIVFTAALSITGTSYYFGVGFFDKGRTKLVVSTTTSLYDTGLLDIVEEKFEAEYPIDIYFISAGTGIAMSYAERGDADMIFVHAPSREFAFLENGFGVCRKIISYNFFTIVGPADDPAQIKGSNPTSALVKIAEFGRQGDIEWLSRGDDSGTNIKEKDLWFAAGFNWELIREEDWFLESGAGMGNTLQIADERSAYTLADMGTYLKYYSDDLIGLEVVVDTGEELLNVYSVIAVDKSYNPEVNFDAAITFIKFLISVEGQQIIDEFGEDKYPKKLFFPAVQLLRENLNPILVDWIEDFAFLNGEECPEEYREGYSELYS
jgi:tungstate transport system substrate-binding protein